MKNPKTKIIIHAGRHKTGTTYLQQFLEINKNTLLSSYSILYPDAGKNPYHYYHHDLIKSFAANCSQTGTSDLANQFEDEVARENPNFIIISSEYLSRSSIDRKFLSSLKNSLSGYDIKIIFYLREQVDFLQSRYAEQVKQGVLSYPKGIESIDAELDYDLFLERYIDVFGKHNVKVHSYEIAKNREGGLLQDFCSWIGIVDISTLSKPVRGSNHRLPWNYLKLIWLGNESMFFRKIISSRPVRYLFKKGASIYPTLFDGPSPLSMSDTVKLRKKYKESNSEVFKKYYGKDNILGIHSESL